MSVGWVGALVGLAFALAEFALFGALIRRAAGRGEAGRGPRVLDLVRKVQLVVFPLVGYLFGQIIADRFGVQ